MATRTFTGSSNWVVPDDNSTITIRCYGGAGASGNASTDSTSWATSSRDTGGANGGYVEGELSVTPGDTLYIRVFGGGNRSSANQDNAHADGGGGGAGASVRKDSEGNIQIAAGGGGGGCGVAIAYDDDDIGGDVETSGPGAGGGNGGNVSGTEGIVNIGSEAEGGGMSGFDGGNGSSSSGNSNNGDAAGAAGGGGGGRWGGEGGQVAVSGGSGAVNAPAVAHAQGGAGGDGYTGGVSSSTQTVGGHAGTAKVEIDFTPRPLPPENLVVDNVEPGGALVELSWEIPDSVTESYNVYRDTQSPVELVQDNLIREDPPGGTSYRDNSVENGEEYFYVVTGTSTSDGVNYESKASNEVSAKTARTFNTWVTEENAPVPQWAPNAVTVFDENDEPYYPEDIYRYDGTDWVLRDT